MAVLSPQEWLQQKNAQQQPQSYSPDAPVSMDVFTGTAQEPSLRMVKEVLNNTPVFDLPAQYVTPDAPVSTEVFTGQAEQQPKVLSPQEWMAQRQQPTFSDKLANAVDTAAEFVKQPAAAALDALSYLDKPRGALAGAVKAMQEGKPVTEGLQQGWKENTSWKETFPEQFQKDDPYYLASIGGLAADVVADPLWVVSPAKVGKAISAVSNATGATGALKKAVQAVADTKLGQNAMAAAEDFAGVNRVADLEDTMKAARAADEVQGQEVLQGVKQLKKDYPDQADTLTNYIEAADKPAYSSEITPAMKTEIVDAVKNGKAAEQIKQRVFSKEDALNTIRDTGEEVPDYLLQTAQRQAKEAGQAIPDYTYRDDILKTVPDNIANQIKSVGDRIINLNKNVSDTLYNTGRLSDAEYVAYQGGSHLRRSFSQYETPEKFLKAVQENGTPEEYRRVYQTLTNKNAPGAQGFGRAHRVDMKDFAGRQNLSDDTLRKLGLITDPEYRVMDTLNRASKTIREDEFLKSVADLFGKKADEAADLSRYLPARRQYVPIPDTEGYGALKGLWVPKDVADQVLKVTGNAQQQFQTLQKLVSWFKVEKLLQPASIMRNFYSGLPMANVFGEVPMTSIPKYMAKATAMMKQGIKNEQFKELKSSGILKNEWSRQELKNILGENPKGIKKAADIGMNWFGKPDEFWRTVVYSYHRDNGKTVQEAAKMANRALFDYSKAPPIIDALSKYGVVPFAKFPYFATKETLRAAYNRPTELSKYIKPMNQQNTEDREKILPDYMRAKTLLPLGPGTRTVNGKPQQVQNNLDLSYILPFANDLTLGNPAIDLLQVWRTGKNAIGMKVFDENDPPRQKYASLAKYIMDSFGPALTSSYNYGKIYDAAMGNVDSRGRQYDLPSALAQVGLGLKNVPVNTEEQYKQKLTSIRANILKTQQLIGGIKKDQSLNMEQKKSKAKEYQDQIKELMKQGKDATEAYKRLKQKGAI